MRYTKLPNTDIEISKICLGTMTWGKQNTEDEAHVQMDMAIDKGINFFDTAELYPVPAEAETQGRTSTYIGTWLKKTGNRDKLILASKITGPGDYTKHIRTGGFSKQNIIDAVNRELKRLQTDYIDLFQLHWPERETNTFGTRDYTHDENEHWNQNFYAVLETFQELISDGKVRFVGLSNEKAWGTMRYLEEAKYNNLPRPITIQNAYSLVNRTFEGDLAEVSHRENIGLLAYSPMAFGILSGKYFKGLDKPNSRLNLFKRFSRYSDPQTMVAAKRYMELAEKYGLSPAQMALAFVTDRPFVTSNIIGATDSAQLEENIESIHLKLGEDILKEINKIHSEIPNPAT
ncbi:aldo/keto reductase [Aegicerativicinus sediminis]|uniref:aldo/keto reductase n=1 Tax=Aegicerativicinus sediminis TaxID=2893202 RepID=UPI001E38DCE9|nr:aldo/keto reductase [Aegicerativicinus sediminis]